MAQRESDALVAGGIPTGQQANLPRPIGVPEAVVDPETGQPVPFQAHAPFRGNNRAVEGILNAVIPGGAAVSPRYFEGDEWIPAAMSPEERARLQQMMVDAGILPAGTRYQRGIWDGPSRAAYADLLAFANGSGLNVDQAIRQWGEASQQYGNTASQVQLPNRMDTLAGVRNTGRGIIGRRLDDATTADIEARWRAAVTQAAAGGTEEAPSLDTFTEETLRAERPEDALRQDYGERMNEFYSLLGGPV